MINKCIVCNKEYYIRPFDYKRGRRCCSKKCGDVYKKKPRGKDHPNWKGDNAKYAARHTHMQRLLPKPNKCEKCGKKTDFLDLANISQEYKRNVEDWEYLCRKCHMIIDGRINNNLTYVPEKRGKHKKCFQCNKGFYRTLSETKNKKRYFCSLKCLGKFQRGKNNEKRKI